MNPNIIDWIKLTFDHVNYYFRNNNGFEIYKCTKRLIKILFGIKY